MSKEYEWLEDIQITDTMGSGWCVRLSGSCIFDDVNRWDCKGRRTLQIAKGLPTKESATNSALHWLNEQRAKLLGTPVEQPVPVSVDERTEPEKFEEWCISTFGARSTNLMFLDGRDMLKAWQARAALSHPSAQAEVVSVPRCLAERLATYTTARGWTELNTKTAFEAAIELRTLLDTRQNYVESESQWPALAAALYQEAGAFDMPERILDVLSAAASGEPFDHLIDGLLPCVHEEPESQRDGWKLVPCEPTNAMTFVGQAHRYKSEWSIGAIYRAMIAEAPSAQTVGKAE